MLRVNNYRIRALGLGQQTASTVLPPTGTSTSTSTTTTTTPSTATPAPAPAPDVIAPSGPSWLPASLRGIDWLKVGAWGAGIGVAVILLTKFMGGSKKKEIAPAAATIVIPQSSSPVVLPSTSSLARELRSWG